jgi:hypothetical protein
MFAAGSAVIADCVPNGLYARVPSAPKRDLGQGRATLEPS